MPIHILAEEVVAKIAAGEVIERPASVVKELIENAVDAGANAIHVALQGDGRRRIQISDNGHGIPGAEAELAFARHATSKLNDSEDLFHIQTLGFRGEALASIAAVSHVTLITRSEGDDFGTSLRVVGGRIEHRRAVGAPRGTVLTIEHLFFNTPARLKFLKKETTEKRHIAGIVTRYAMAYPQIRFTLEQDGYEVFRTSGNGRLIDVVVSAMGIEQTRDMLEVDQTSGAIQVLGYTSAPRLNRADRQRITLFVNGRWVQDSGLTYAVIQAYHTLLMTGRFPISVLLINLPPEDVDVNVHPTKAEVRFRDADAVFSAVQRAVRRAVIEQGAAPRLSGARHSAFAGRYSETGSGDADESAGSEEQTPLDMPLETPGQFARHRSLIARGDADLAAEQIPERLGTPLRPRTLPPLRVVGQIAASYIVAEGPAGMYLIDQHAAHERILYEQFMAEYARQGNITQLALEAQSLQVAPDEARLLEEKLPLLHELGFDLEAFGPSLFIVRGVPAMLADTDPASAIGGILDDLALGNQPGMASIEEKIVVRVCKSAAVKAGQVLNHTQMQGIIQQLERCQSPLTCPHGRPTMILMSNAQLEKEFGRIQ
ncbi:MAG: DNA mismatch repair endonuclease MutL [Anaerolineae bacterium]|nr:DNA mismatch repair endonuclease MutL [Anaerolineae bacterium]NUQ02759.1 DNA mismatch repair endonuclease MutL [Anaerolineae bacterium]